MTHRRTYASVTKTVCTCMYLGQAADDPRSPIVFDADTGEYQFTYQEPECTGPSSLVIYHCPFCGGAAPESKRHLRFAVIPAAEEQRLIALLAPVRSGHDALKIL